MTEITLYQFPECPYCVRVQTKLQEKGLAHEEVNVSLNREDLLRKELLGESGLPTVPVIKINDKYLGESDKIIAYLEENF